MTALRKQKNTSNVILIAVCVLAIIVTRFLPRNTAVVETISKIPNLSAESNSQRIEFLKRYNIECVQEPCEIRDVVVPLEFNATFLKYEALLKKQGLSLENYKGETVRRYSYKIKDKNALAELVVHNKKIVACAGLSLEKGGDFFQIIT